ncbi:MAG: dipeptidase PepE [Candidatus Marinimicrobia bacterium]|nr:dipeptidase PepE [Candidatus Neomarinimicrobiota bacterium]
MSRNLLLISNSTLHGSGYLDHCAENIKTFLGNRKTVAFVPFARPGGIGHNGYTEIARKRFAKMDFDLSGVHEAADMKAAIRQSDAIFIGGGNTFVLLTGLYKHDLIDTIREEVANGKPYIGTSAGSNVATRSIMTTNDMPIMYPPSFEALNLVPFNINPHYLDPDPDSRHMGETRETRIKEFHVFNDVPVVGLREGAMLHVEDNRMTLKGTTGARLMEAGKEAVEYQSGDDLSFLL